MEVKESDRAWVKEHYPELVSASKREGEEIVGVFNFTAAWDETRRIYLINPTPEESGGLIRIVDSYSIRIAIDEKGVPSLAETGGRILGKARSIGVPPRDLHVYEDGTACPTGTFDMVDFACLQDYLDRPVLQFFHDQSYHERYGRWPRGQYLHGLPGVIENFYDQGEERLRVLADKCLGEVFDEKRTTDDAVLIRGLITDKQRIQGHWLCLCGSRKSFKECHKSLFHGMWFLQKYLKEGRRL